MTGAIIQKIPSLSNIKESAVNFSHSASNKAVVYGGKLFSLIGLKEVHQGLYKEAYLNKDYKAAANTAVRGLLKLGTSAAVVAAACFGALKAKELLLSKEEIPTDDERAYIKQVDMRFNDESDTCPKLEPIKPSSVTSTIVNIATKTGIVTVGLPLLAACSYHAYNAYKFITAFKASRNLKGDGI